MPFTYNKQRFDYLYFRINQISESLTSIKNSIELITLNYIFYNH